LQGFIESADGMDIFLLRRYLKRRLVLSVQPEGTYVS